MKIKDVITHLEKLAPPILQEHYDNTGLICGSGETECTGILISLDATENVIREANSKNCNLVISHHPIIFSELKKIANTDYVGRAVIGAIKNDISLYAVHTNLDNILHGVNGKIAALLGLTNSRALTSKEGILKKLYTFVPKENATTVRNAIFEAGGGHIGNYSECSFNTEGFGTFRGSSDTSPFAGKPGILLQENELKIEVIFPHWLESRIIQNLIASHPYEEVAYDVIQLDNTTGSVGSGVIGSLEGPVSELAFLAKLKEIFKLKVIKHTALLNRPVKTVAVCGGAGSFLISKALANQADFFITSDIRYHEFFDANDRMVIADIGHYESEQFTISLLHEILVEKFPTFAVLKTEVSTNPVQYYL